MRALGTKLRKLLALEQDWLDNIMITELYHEELSSLYDKGLEHTEYQWKHLQDSFLEMNHVKKMREEYLKSLDAGKLDEALKIANDTIRYELDPEPVE